MNKHSKLAVSLIATAIILMAIGITGFHHHLPNAEPHHDCEVCNFINVVNTIVLPVIVFACILSVLKAVILTLSKGISSENLKVYSSRAPPAILS